MTAFSILADQSL